MTKLIGNFIKSLLWLAAAYFVFMYVYPAYLQWLATLLT